ncbi:YdcH family protein [Thalassotalea sediminis]|uniref:YdcH family protein n=1 Tax=Thalassotalea sediminis TaxID=1759089 RepID=UPI00257446A3|nr:DUF465 domain-containing protein [Thalassotalea sediminis]
MQIEKHDLHHEFPEYKTEIHQLKMNDGHFSRLFKEYDEVEHAVHRIETGAEHTSDDHLEKLKVQRLQLKDQLFTLLKEAKQSA